MATTFVKQVLTAGGNPLTVKITVTWDNTDLTPTAYVHGGPKAVPKTVVHNLKALGVSTLNVSVDADSTPGSVTVAALGEIASIVEDDGLGAVTSNEVAGDITGAISVIYLEFDAVANQDGTSFLPAE